jgi:uncharacterized protein (DUF2141 family)
MSALLALLAAAVFGIPDACAPDSGKSAALVTVHGFKDREGNVRIAIYRAREDELLASGLYVQRLDTPVTANGDMTICAPVPAAGDYVVAALHDRDANGKFGAFRDGVGFSRNPRLGLDKPKVEVTQVRLDGVTPMRIELNYLHGLKVGPVRQKQTR